MRLSPTFTLLAAVLLAEGSPVLEAVRRQATPTIVTSSTPPPSVKLVKPNGGIGFNETPTYMAKSDFDYQSFNLGLHQELIELDLFHHGLAMFSDEQFAEAGLGPAETYLLQYMAEQEEGHAQLIANMMGFKQNFVGAQPTFQCEYNYPNFTSVRDFLDFSRLITRYGESGTIGFLGHLNAQDSASLINDAIQTEGRQQLLFRQFSGLFPMPFFFTTSITQSMQWTMLAPYIKSCPASAPPVAWTAFPSLEVTNNPFWPDLNLTAAVSSNETAVTYTGRQVNFKWGAPGEPTGWNNSFTTKTMAKGAPAYVAWISQLNTTYTPLTVNNDSSNTGFTIQPFASVYNGSTTPLLNASVYTIITDAVVPVTPYNLSLIESHILAGPTLYNVG